MRSRIRLLLFQAKTIAFLHNAQLDHVGFLVRIGRHAGSADKNIAFFYVLRSQQNAFNVYYSLIGGGIVEFVIVKSAYAPK